MKSIPHGNARYNWDTLFDGSWRKMRFGKDFHCQPRSFRQQVIARAARMQMDAETRILENGVVAFRVSPVFAPKKLSNSSD